MITDLCCNHHLSRQVGAENYPVNGARNAAIDAVVTSHWLLSDIDQMPNFHSYEW